MAKKEFLKLYDLPRGTKFEVLTDDCSVTITTFEGRGAAGVIEHGRSHKLKKGDIILWDHQAYLGSDPGPGNPWFTVPGVGRGAFYPNDWGQVETKHLKRIE